jgi:DNA-binding response OmpR family regulator
MYKLLSVDDEPINQAIVEELFANKFDVSLASSGEECLENIHKNLPDLILLDVSMVGMDGYETCRELKKDEITRDIPIIFVSARGTLEDKIKAYEAGGYDYITKPFNHSELEIKIKHTIEANQQASANTKTQTSGTAIPAIINFADAEISIQFLTACYTSNSFDNLAELLLNSCRNLGLNCTFQFRSRLGISNFSTKNEISPLEQSLFDQTLNVERFYSFHSRVMITFPHVSLLVKNMPIDDTTRYDELKNLLEMFSKSIETQINSLVNELTLKQQNEQIIKVIRQHLTDFEKHAESIREKNTVNIQEHLEKLEKTCVPFELNEQQIELIKSMNIEFLAKNNSLFFADMSLEEKIGTLEKAIKKLSELD